MFIYFFYLVDPKFIDVDGLAEEVGKIVLDKELKFLRGTFGIRIVIWPLLKKYGGRLIRKCKYDFFK